jgi:hypothetical protein
MLERAGACLGRTAEQLAHQTVRGVLRSRRVVSIALAGIIVYALTFFVLKRDASYREETFTSAIGTTAPLTLYIDFRGVRKVDSTIVGALVAMVFSVAVLRNVLPGAPPIGVSADLAIFLWAEVAFIAGLSLLVTAWVKRGPGV